MSKLIVIFYSFSNALTKNFSFNRLTAPILVDEFNSECTEFCENSAYSISYAHPSPGSVLSFAVVV